LVHQMTQSEQKINSIINSVECHEELASLVDVKRADLLNLFNYLLRYQVAEYLGNPDAGVAPTLDLRNKDWNQAVKEFQVSTFGADATAFANYITQHMAGLASTEVNYIYYGKCGSYTIDVSDFSQKNLGNFASIIKPVIQKAINRGEFLQPIECENGDIRHCIGTFYLVIPFDELPEEEYEKLPALRIKNNLTGEEIKEIILPRRKYKLYVPVRIFRILAEVMAFVHSPNARKEPYNQNSAVDLKKDYGLFSPRIHNELEEIALGICDYGFCKYRLSPFNKPDAYNMEDDCPVPDTSGPKINICDYDSIAHLSERGICRGTTIEYSPYNTSSMKNAVSKIAKRIVCYLPNRINNLLPEKKLLDLQSEGLAIVKQNLAGNYYEPNLADPNECPFRVTATAIAKPSAQIEESCECSNIVANPMQEYRANLNGVNAECPLLRRTDSKLGIFIKDGNLASPLESLLYNPDTVCGASSRFASYAKCTELAELRVEIAFEEKNPLYKVDNRPSKRYIYRINLIDRFAPFSPCYTQGNVTGNCTLANEPTDISYMPWICKQFATNCGFSCNVHCTN
ncbi:MAG: hypothetical protein J7L14_00920, partial [Candidatus Diapherotrites archaeon]|nr:hypothetical protein [Candidatus Diapherotrites archaeon]